MKKKVVIVVVLLGMLLLASCRTEFNEHEESVKQSESESSEELLYFKSDEEIFEIETPYVSLAYPRKWESRCEVTQQKEAERYIISFTTKEEQIRLFDVVFGDAANSTFELGTIEVDDKPIKVSIIDYSLEVSEMYSIEEYSFLYEMIEDMNVVVSGLVYDHKLVIIG